MGVATLFRVSLLMTTCAVWVIAQAPQAAQENEDVIPEWLFASGEEEDDVTRIISTRKPQPGWVKGGTSCLNTDECGQGKCCLRRSKSPRRRCRRFQRIGEHCTEEQMMGGYYYGHCPCNKNGVCTYTGDGLRCVPKKEEKPQTPEVPPPQVPAPHPTLPPKERPGQKPDSQESEETTGKPVRPGKPTQETGGNELPDLPFETLTGPGENSNVIPPLNFQAGGNRLPGTGGRPSAPVSATSSPNSVYGPTPSTNLGGTFGQEGNTVPTSASSSDHGGTRPANGPSTAAQGVPTSSTPLSSALSGNNVPPNLGGSQNPLPAPPLASGNNSLPFPTGHTGQSSGISSVPPTNVNNQSLPGAEQKPSQFPSRPLPTTGENGLPPIVDEGPPPPPLPPSPIDVLNGRASLRAQE